MATVFENPGELRNAVGKHLGYSEWLEITQQRIDLFAEATGDHQWIHVDPERARKGPFGTTIAHGYLSMSLVSHFLPQIVVVKGISMGVNYGADRLRFPAPVPVGSRIRAGAELVEAEPAKDGSIQARLKVTIEVEGKDRPCCVVETLSRFYPAA